jgi:competence protein ComEC
MRDKIFHTVCFGFLLGVLLRSFVFIDNYYVLLFAIIFLAVLLFFIFVSQNNWGILFCVLVVSFNFGILRFHMVDVSNPAVFELQMGKKVVFSGEIIDEPSIKENNQQLTVETSVKDSPSPKTRLLLSTGLDEYYRYGDEINFQGVLKKPENFTTDTGKEFDYINYLRKDGILYMMSYPKIEIISSDNGNKLQSILFLAKEKFLEKMSLVISAPENLLMGGLILGEKSSFSQALRESFVNTGTIHIVALSGYNVTIVAEWIMKLFSFLPLSFAIGSGILAIILFILMTGGSSTAVRAGTMATLALVARATGRNYDVARALILAGVSMVIINPFLLVFDVSFQLSFIATVAVIFFAPRIEKYFLWVPEKFGLRDIVAVTSAAYVFVFPFILYKMGNLSLVALPANVLILPFIPLTMILGFLTGFMGLVSSILAIPLGFVSCLLLHYELSVISFFSNVPFASFSFPNFSLWLTLFIYTYFIYRLFGRNIRKFFEFETTLPL